MTTAGRSQRHRRRNHIPRLAAALLAAATGLAVLTACGSGSDSGTGTAAKSSPGGGSSAATPTRDVVSGVRADPALRAELPAAVRDSGTLSLGTVQAVGTSGLPHAGQAPDGSTVGLDVDLRDAVAKVLGVSWKVDYGTFPTIIPGVQNGRFDVGQANFGVTAAREKVVDFATYLDDGQAFLGGRDTTIPSVGKLTDLCGLTVATSPGSTFQQILTSGATKCAAVGRKPYRVRYFTDTAPIFLGLANGTVDVYFGPTLGLKYDAAHIASTKFLGQISTTPVGFVTRKGSPLGKALSDAVNKLIADGTYKQIFAKWGVPGTGIPTSRLNPPATF
ncbi:transporter substrate-binding domain-containing protein [Streptantibioticus parmotrematis]|uniref:transporter substrate-binding domain-containing protein n=1 Tax=Streptantibioticus parmotrematis TaxID=2873249 RepID=UPI0033D7B7FD